METNKVLVSFTKIETVERNLKNEFIEISQSHLCKQLTLHMIEELRCEYDNLFLYFGLSDLRYSLIKDRENNQIKFVPHREIDRLAINGILNS